MGALVRRLSARNGPIGPVVTLSLAPDVAADPDDGGPSSTSRRGLTPAPGRQSAAWLPGGGGHGLGRLFEW